MQIPGVTQSTIGRRILALLMNSFLWGVVWVLAMIAVEDTGLSAQGKSLIFFAACFVPPFVCALVRGSPGKAAFFLQVLTWDEERIGVGASIIRSSPWIAITLATALSPYYDNWVLGFLRLVLAFYWLVYMVSSIHWIINFPLGLPSLDSITKSSVYQLPKY